MRLLTTLIGIKDRSQNSIHAKENETAAFKTLTNTNKTVAHSWELPPIRL